MNRSTYGQRPLFQPSFAWLELPDDIRQQTLDVLTAIYLETVDPQDLEPEDNNDESQH